MADPAQDEPETDQDLGGMITFIPDVALEWELPFEIEVVFEGDELE